jgi:hypothetical protein
MRGNNRTRVFNSNPLFATQSLLAPSGVKRVLILDRVNRFTCAHHSTVA